MKQNEPIKWLNDVEKARRYVHPLKVFMWSSIIGTGYRACGHSSLAISELCIKTKWAEGHGPIFRNNAEDCYIPLMGVTALLGLLHHAGYSVSLCSADEKRVTLP